MGATGRPVTERAAAAWRCHCGPLPALGLPCPWARHDYGPRKSLGSGPELPQGRKRAPHYNGAGAAG